MDRSIIIMQYYCHECALKEKIIIPIDSHMNFTGSFYQLEKYLKHTVPLTRGTLVSVFDKKEYDTYSNYIVNTAASGSVEVDTQGRINIVWYAGENIGVTYINNRFVSQCLSVKLVLHEHKNCIHPFPTSSNGITFGFCETCGKTVFI